MWGTGYTVLGHQGRRIWPARVPRAAHLLAYPGLPALLRTPYLPTWAPQTGSGEESRVGQSLCRVVSSRAIWLGPSTWDRPSGTSLDNAGSRLYLPLLFPTS